MALSGCTQPTRAEPPPAPVRPLAVPVLAPARSVVWIGGDTMLSEGMRRVINAEAADPRVPGAQAESVARILAPVAQWFERDDDAFVLVNLESPVATRRNQIDRTTWGSGRLVAIPLNLPSYTLDALSASGVHGLMLSNNHALDQDPEGLIETLAAARRRGFVTTGAGQAPAVIWPITVGDPGSRITIVPMYDGHRLAPTELGAPGLSMVEAETIAAVAELDDETDLLVPVVHVLGEAVDQVKPEWRVWARQLVDAGADLIVCHGTHVPLPVETITSGDRTVPIVWGLGNFLGDMARQANPRRPYYRGMPKDQNPMIREGLLVRIEMNAGQPVDVSFLPTWINDGRFVRYWGGFERRHRFRLLPVAACGEPVAIPDDWTGELRERMVEWISGRRDHLIGHAGLDDAGCVPGQPELLRARALGGATRVPSETTEPPDRGSLALGARADHRE